MLTTLARRLTYPVAILFALLGSVLFVAPSWAADNFPWRVSNFLAMTMGAWYLGSAVIAFAGARLWRWALAHAILLYTWLFGFFQAVLLLVHADDLRTGEALAWPYIVTLAVAALNAVVGAVEIAQRRPARTPAGAPVPRLVRVLTALFVVAVALLALPLLDGYDNPRSIWPGELTLISARGFAVFFGSLALSTAPLVLARGLDPVLAYLRPAGVLTILILAAAFVYIDQFDFRDHPGGLIYIGLYVVVLAASAVIVAYPGVYGKARGTSPLEE